MIYAINGTIVHSSLRKNGVYKTTHQIPTFYLDSNVQGIVSEDHAVKVALDIFRAFQTANTSKSSYEYNLTAVSVRENINE